MVSHTCNLGSQSPKPRGLQVSRSMLRLIFLVNPTPSESSQTLTSGYVQQGVSKKIWLNGEDPRFGNGLNRSNWMEWQLWFLLAADAVRPATICSCCHAFPTGVHWVPPTMGQNKLFLPEVVSHTNKKSDYSLGSTADFQEKGKKSHRHFFLISKEVP